ncbi:MAG: M56 family metallopeptidase [Terracidiphilus sp.]|nr:M56 family metallopeptidase [Terracidiphilus sp.]
MQLETVILNYAVNALWQAPLLLAAGWVGAKAARGLGPRAEHRVWVLALLAQSLLPALSTVEWGQLLARLRALLENGAVTHGIGNVAVEQGAGAATTGLALPPWAMHTAVSLYGMTIAYFAARLVWQLMKLRTLRQSARALELDGEAANVWARCTERFDVERTQLAASDRVAAPVTLGVRRPLIVLPVTLADELAEAEHETVLAHECAHIGRRDFAKNLAYELAVLPVRWHPAVWMARARVTETREMVCDALAAETAGRVAYGQSLLRLAARLAANGQLRMPLATGIFDTDGLERRIMRLAEAKQMVTGARRAAMVMLCAALGAGTCTFALGLRVHVAAVAAAAVEQGAKPVQVSAEKMVVNLLHKETPVYPPDAKKKRVQGKVVLKATIAKDGTIENLQVVSGPPKLQQSSLDAVRQWTYKPYLLNGEPVEVETTINIIYTLGK